MDTLPSDGLLGIALATSTMDDALDEATSLASSAQGPPGTARGTAAAPGSSAPSDRLHVNLHAGLEALLRESRYLLQLGLDIPRTAAGVYRRDQQVRKY